MNTTPSHTHRVLDELSATHLGQPPRETTLLVTKHTVQIPEQVPEAQTPGCTHMQTDARIHTKTHTHTHPPHIKHTTADPPHKQPPTNKHEDIDTCHHTHTHQGPKTTWRQKGAHTRQRVAVDHLRALD